MMNYEVKIEKNRRLSVIRPVNFCCLNSPTIMKNFRKIVKKAHPSPKRTQQVAKKGGIIRSSPLSKINYRASRGYPKPDPYQTVNNTQHYDLVKEIRLQRTPQELRFTNLTPKSQKPAFSSPKTQKRQVNNSTLVLSDEIEKTEPEMIIASFQACRKKSNSKLRFKLTKEDKKGKTPQIAHRKDTENFTSLPKLPRKHVSKPMLPKDPIDYEISAWDPDSTTLRFTPDKQNLSDQLF